MNDVLFVNCICWFALTFIFLCLLFFSSSYYTSRQTITSYIEYYDSNISDVSQACVVILMTPNLFNKTHVQKQTYYMIINHYDN